MFKKKYMVIDTMGRVIDTFFTKWGAKHFIRKHQLIYVSIKVRRNK